MPAPRPPAFDTLSLHAGQHPDPATGARAVPIYETTSYVFDDSDHAAALFNLERAGHIYSRISNPTTAVLEERIAALEGGVGALCTASGMAALHLAIATLAGAGDHIVASSSLYGGTINLLTQTLPRFGIRASLVNPRDHAGLAAAIGPQTRLVLGETIGNPGLEVLDIPAVAKIAHDSGVPLLIDNTFATPYLSRPSRGRRHRHAFADQMDRRARPGDRRRPRRFRPLRLGRLGSAPDDDRALRRLPRPHLRRAFRPVGLHHAGAPEGLRDFGACLSPHNAARLLTGVETLSLRMQRHIENTHAVLAALSANEAVTWVTHPSLPDHADHELAARLLPRGAGSIVSFGVKGGRAAGRKFVEALRLASHLANVGDAKTLASIPRARRISR